MGGQGSASQTALMRGVGASPGLALGPAFLVDRRQIKTVFDAIEEDYFRERRSDIDFVGDRILRNLLGVDAGTAMPPPGAVIVAHDLSPADTAHLHRASCVAFVTDVGGKTSHSAIL